METEFCGLFEYLHSEVPEAIGLFQWHNHFSFCLGRFVLKLASLVIRVLASEMLFIPPPEWELLESWDCLFITLASHSRLSLCLLTPLVWYNEFVNEISRQWVTSLMANSGLGIFVFPGFLIKFTMSWPHIRNWKYFVLLPLKCPLACFTVIWFFVLRCRGNKFPLIEGSCYEDLHYCLVLTNRILQKLVINVMGRSEHATWVITSDPACLMVCYAEQRAAGACWGKDKAEGSETNFFLKLSNL